MSTNTSGVTLAVFAILNLIVGLTAVWIYVGIRPRFGAGHMTAVYAGLATWLLTFVESHVFIGTVGLFPATSCGRASSSACSRSSSPPSIGAYFYREETT